MQMKRSQVIKVSSQEGLRENDGPGVRIFITELKNLKERPLLTRLASYNRYSSDTTLSHLVLEKQTKCIPICMPGKVSYI
jgi:hypothetical protein